MGKAAFVTLIPCKSRNSSTLKSQAHPSICKYRASAGPAAPNNDSGETNEHIDKLSESRNTLENFLKLELKSSKEHNGQCECIWCEGSKQRKCSWCDGAGVRYEIVHKSWDELSEDLEKLQSGQAQFVEEPKKLPVTCSACSGTKKLRCRYCRGSGVGSYGHAY